MDVAPGASGDVRDGGALLDIPSQAAVHLELDPSRINVRARSFAAGSAGGQDQECSVEACGSQKKACVSLDFRGSPRAVEIRA